MKSLKRSLQLFLIFLLTFVTAFTSFAGAEPGDRSLNYVALGNSLAYGTSFENTQIKSYPVFIKEGVEAQTAYEVNLANYGFPGFKTPDLLNQLNDDAVRTSLAEADFITIDIGANDLLEAVDIVNLDPADPAQLAELEQNATAALGQIGTNVPAIVGQIRAVNAEAPIYLMGYYNALPYIQEAQPQIEQLIHFLNVTLAGAEQTGEVTFIPTYDVFVGNYEAYLPNPTNIHPSEAGYKAIGDRFLLDIIPYLETLEQVEPEPDPDPDPETVNWIYGEGSPAVSDGADSDLYVDIRTADVYVKTDGAWAQIGNLLNPTEQSPWLYGEGAPAAETGAEDDLYVDTQSQKVYFKLQSGWTSVFDFSNPDPDPETVNWLYGEDTPEASDGEDGDLYIDTLTADVYVKSDGFWSKISNLFNPTEASPWLSGEGEPAAESGEEGDLYVDTASQTVYFKIDSEWTSVFDFTEPVPELERWAFGKGEPNADEEAAYYLDTETGDVYENVNGIWTKAGNLNEYSEGAPWLIGEGDPNEELGEIGDLYVDTVNETAYLKRDRGWILVGSFAEEEPVPEEDPEDPVTDEEDEDKDEEKPAADDEKKDTSKEDSDKDGDVVIAEKPADKTKTADKKEMPAKGGILPSTATNIYTYLAIGLLFVLAGGGYLAFRRLQAVKK